MRSSADFGSRAQLADDLAEARINQALRRQTDISSAMGNFQLGGQTLGQNILSPTFGLANLLRSGQQNELADSFTEQTMNLGFGAIEDALRTNADQSSINNFLAVLNGVGSLVQGASGFF